jgi:hypothetical protein
MGIAELLKSQTEGILSEDSLKEIENVFNKSVEEKAKLHIEKALIDQDADYAAKLKNLLEVVDKDHTNKLLKVVEAIDSNHSHKLQLLVAKFNKELNSNAKGFKDSMINNVSTYLEAYLDEAIPAEKLTEAIKSKRAQVVLEQIKEMLGVDTAVASKSIKSAIVDGKRQIDEANQRLEAAQKELKQIKEEYTKSKSELVLEKKLNTVSGKKKDYLKKVLAGKSAEFISENFDYASNLFEKSTSERLQTLKEEATTSVRSVKVDRPVVEEKVVVESNNEFDAPTYMSPYLTELNKF